MKCPYCGEVDSKVIDSRPTEDGEKIRRRRECLNCKKRFTTYEIVETVPLMVVKKDRSREVFDRQKLLNGMLRACEKRPVSYTQLDAAVDRIEQQLLNSYDREVSSIHIGDLAMQELKKMDDVAYVRFASVYRQFSDVNTFMEELKDMLDSRSKPAIKSYYLTGKIAVHSGKRFNKFSNFLRVSKPACRNLFGKFCFVII